MENGRHGASEFNSIPRSVGEVPYQGTAEAPMVLRKSSIISVQFVLDSTARSTRRIFVQSCCRIILVAGLTMSFWSLLLTISFLPFVLVLFLRNRKAQVGSRAHPCQVPRSCPSNLWKGRPIRYSRHWQEEVFGTRRSDSGTISLCHSQANQTGAGKSLVPLLLKFHSTKCGTNVDGLRGTKRWRWISVHPIQWGINLWRSFDGSLRRIDVGIHNLALELSFRQ